MIILFVIRTVSNLIYAYSLVLAAYALLSWFPGAYQTAFGRLIIRLAEPYVNLFRRFPLRFGGLDFTVLVAILALNLLNRVFFMAVGLLLNFF